MWLVAVEKNFGYSVYCVVFEASLRRDGCINWIHKTPSLVHGLVLGSASSHHG